MNKIVLTVMILLSGLALMYAEAPELRYVIPNSWRKVTRLSPVEETAFLQANRAIEDTIKTKTGFNSRFVHPSDTLDHTLVYKQTAGIDEFYRMMLVHEQEPDFMSGRTSFVQGLVYKETSRNMLVAVCAYNERSGSEVGSGLTAAYRGIDIIEGGGRAKGILISRMGTFMDDESPEEYWYIIKGQPAGGVKAYYMLMDWTGDTMDLKLPVRGSGNEYLPGNARYIEINGSNCLVDRRSPLRYSLASAFDNDPSTSYVENTENDLMLLTFYIENAPSIRGIAVINGYAQNTQLYQANNRIKRFISRMVDKILDDGILSYQYISENAGLLFNVKEIYKGNAYNDTCLAELNFLTADGWLFGDINE